VRVPWTTLGPQFSLFIKDNYVCVLQIEEVHNGNESPDHRKSNVLDTEITGLCAYKRKTGVPACDHDVWTFFKCSTVLSLMKLRIAHVGTASATLKTCFRHFIL
jgi:hypothetical protein